MRLTLRTLLAYLDDTLQAAEIKEIGQKVAESDAAQELIARLKAVTRRRRLTAPPPTGPNGLDPNCVAEYLDNELASRADWPSWKSWLSNPTSISPRSPPVIRSSRWCWASRPWCRRRPGSGCTAWSRREAIPFRKATPAKTPAEGQERRMRSG